MTRYNRFTVNETPDTPQLPVALPPPPAEQLTARSKRPWVLMVLVAGLAATLGYVWHTSSRISLLEAELVKRQEQTQSRSQEAQLLARQAQDMSRDALARATLLDAKLAEVALQRSQLDELIQSVSRTRDENLLAELNAALRVAMQQSALTGSAEPLVSALQSMDSRLAHATPVRMEGIRRAILKDLDELKATQIEDLQTLSIRLDEAIRQVDELPIVSLPQDARVQGSRPDTRPVPARSQITPVPERSDSWASKLLQWGNMATQSAWQEAKTLVRVTRIAHPEAALMSPDQAFFVRENLKLRLLNARLSLISRQIGTAQSDLLAAGRTIDQYFDLQSRKTRVLKTQLDEIAVQTRHVQIPRPDDTLAAISALSGTH